MAIGFGNWRGLPELGITEMFGGNKASVEQAKQNPINMSNIRDIAYQIQNPNNPTSYSSGKVLGASATSNNPTSSGSYSSSSGGAPKSDGSSGGDNSGPDDSAIRDSIDSRYNDAMKYLDQKAGLLPSRQAEDTGFVNEQYNTQLTGLDQSNQAAQQKLDAARNTVSTNKANSIRELGSNLRQMLTATGMQLGAMGAGDSSASQVMAPYAYSKLANQGRGDILRQSNQQYADIDQKAVDVQNTYTTEKSNIDSWRSTQMRSLQDYYRQLQDQIDSLRQNASAERQQAIQQLESFNYQNIVNRANEIESAARDYAQSLDAWAKERLAGLNDAKIQLSQNANYSPEAIAQSEMSSMSTYSNPEEMFYNPLAYIKKKTTQSY